MLQIQHVTILSSLQPIKCLETKRQPLRLEHEASKEVPDTCILSNIQQGATLLFPKRIPLNGFLWENGQLLTRCITSINWFKMNLWSRSRD